MSNAPLSPQQAQRLAWLVRFLPFAGAVSDELPLSRLLRLSLFQVSCGMTAVLLTGTLNRVMIVELAMPAWIVGLMVAIPLLFAPFRALLGFKSDTHKSAFGWRRGPYIWFGSLAQFGGLAIMPFALLILSEGAVGPRWIGFAGAALGFLLAGAGMHTVQTAGLALATDIAREEKRPQTVAALYIMLLLGMLVTSLVIGAVLVDFTALRLIQVIQGAAALAIVLNVIAMWQQEPRLGARNPDGTPIVRIRPEEGLSFSQAWARFAERPGVRRLLVSVGLGAAAFSMQDVLLEPYGGQVLGMSVGHTTLLTTVWALGTLVGFLLASRRLVLGAEPHRLAGFGALIGLAAFATVILSAPMGSPVMFAVGVALIGLGGGLFSVGTLTAAMGLVSDGLSGLVLGAWGAVQATTSGIAIALAGGLRDWLGGLAASGGLGKALHGPATGYLAIYLIELLLLFATLVAIGPLARHAGNVRDNQSHPLGLAEFPT
jgi:MFS transporter, BCD family, chlorophyll transporter